MGGQVVIHEAEVLKQKGIDLGISRGKILGAVELVRDGLLSFSNAAAHLKMSEEEFSKYMKTVTE